MSRRRRSTAIDGQFAPRLIEMLASPAFRALSLSARRVLDRIEIELAHHGGTNNGKLPVTYGDFERYGVDHQAIAPALRELEALGFIRITERGRPSESDFGRHPNLFLITYRQGAHREGPTHEWKRHNERGLKDMITIARLARGAKDADAVRKAKARQRLKSPAGGGKNSASGGKNHPVIQRLPGGEDHPTATGWNNPTTIDISGRENAA